MQARAKPNFDPSHRHSPRAVCGIDQAHIKAALGTRIADTLVASGLTQAAMAELLGVDQPKVSRLIHGQLGDFSTPRLLRFLALLGQDIEITVRTPTARKTPQVGRVRVIAEGTSQP